MNPCEPIVPTDPRDMVACFACGRVAHREHDYCHGCGEHVCVKCAEDTVEKHDRAAHRPARGGAA